MRLSASLLVISAIALASTTAAKRQCPPHVVAAATGINLNIVGPKAELAFVKLLQKIQSDTNQDGYPSAFEIGEGQLIASIELGQLIRTFNQKTLPSGNDAISGLATVQKAQGTELDLAKSLTGKAEHDRKVLATLVTDIENGTAQNKKNLAAVSDFF
jgi:hypothetical protein